jgi:hypothetical protein
LAEEDPTSAINQVDDDDDDLGSADALNASFIGTPVSATTNIAPGGVTTFGQITTELSNFTFSISDFIHLRLSKLIAVRTDSTCSVDTKDYMWYAKSLI